MTQSAPKSSTVSLSQAARGAVLWAGGFTLLSDVLQFGTMLVLVRLLTPEDYGRVALAQSALSFIAVVSYTTFLTHALQARDPGSIDWQIHFTSAAALNGAAFCLTLLLAGSMYWTERYSGAAMPLAALAFVFLMEVPSVLRQTMLQVEHNWLRFRAIKILGSALGSLAAIAVALFGGGFWALIVSALVFNLPSALDLVIFARWRPDWSWSWSRYSEIARFGGNRMLSAALNGGRGTAENMNMVGLYDYATLGVFSRSTGLAILVAGRPGEVIVSSLYPVMTRAEQGSDEFGRMATLVLRCITWITVPSVTFVVLTAPDIVSLLYGAKWSDVAVLLPLAAVQMGFRCLTGTTYAVMLADHRPAACLLIDIVGFCLYMVLIFTVLPFGPQTYLWGLIAHGFVILALISYLLVNAQILRPAAMWGVVAPAVLASAAAAATLLGLRTMTSLSDIALVRLVLEGCFFSVIVVAIIRVLVPNLLLELLKFVPGGQHLDRLLLLRSRDR